MAPRRSKLPDPLEKELAGLVDDVLRGFDVKPDANERVAIRRKLEELVDRRREIEIDYEIKFLSLFAIRHKARIGASSSRAKLLVLLLPSLMLVLAIGGAVTLFWVLAIFRHA